MKYLLSLLIITSFSFQTKACLNEYGRTIEGKRIFTKWFTIPERLKHHNIEQVKKDLATALENIKNDSTNYQYWSNASVNYMKLGRVQEAIEILEPLQKKHPKQYNLIANLGTAYELSGQLDSALKYISLGFKINPKSHRKSEWIHIKILEAKIKEKKQPNWLDYNPVLSKKLLKSKIHNGFFRKLDDQIITQIRTRVPFTPAPNKVIKNILVSMGQLHQSEGAYESAFLYFAYAYQFEGNNYRKQSITRQIENLNIARLKGKRNVRLPRHFNRTIAKSRIDPSLLTLGLNKFAAYQDSIDVTSEYDADSLAILKAELDSISKLPTKIETIFIDKPTLVTVQKTNWWLTFALGLLFAFCGIFGYKQLKK